MLGFGRRAKALRVLLNDFGMAREEVSPVYLGLFVKTGANEYDAAFHYLIARARRDADATSEATIKSDLLIIDHLADKASNPDEVRQLVRAARQCRHDLEDTGFHSFDTWLSRFKSSCAEINDWLREDTDGVSAIDFIDQNGLRAAHRDGVAPDTLAAQFAPTFHPDTFGR